MPEHDLHDQVEHTPAVSDAVAQDHERQSKSSTLDNRYGTSRRAGIDRRFAWVTAIVLVAIGLAFLIFSGWQDANRIDYQDIGFTVESDQVVEVRFDVTAPPYAEVGCALQALNSSKGTVGWKVVTIPVSENTTHRVSTSVVTTGTPVTGSVNGCWLLSD